MTREIMIDERFNGPPRVVNGGYACATVTSALDRPGQATLRRPVPVATPLVVSSHEGRATLSTPDDQLLAEAVPADRPEPPSAVPVSLEDARAAMTQYPARSWGERMFPCFVCGPDRPDSYGVFPGPVRGGDVAAAVWQTDQTMTDRESGNVLDELVWAVLDCTGSWAAIIANGLQTGALLGRMTAHIVDRPQAGAAYVGIGRADTRDGRKLPAEAALFTEHGDLLAHADLLCIEPRPHRPPAPLPDAHSMSCS